MTPLPGLPGGAYLQGNQVFLNGAPYMGNGGPLYYNNGVYSGTNPTPTPAPVIPPINTGGSTSLYNPYAGPNIGNPALSGPTNATSPGANYTNPGAYNPPENNAWTQIGQIDPKLIRQIYNLQSLYGPGKGSLLNQYGTVGKPIFQQLQAAASGQLPPGVQREIQQQVAGQEAGTGNTSGVTQAVEQGMTTGTAGLNYLQSTLAQAQGYLGGKSAFANQFGNYITGGASPYGITSNYVNNAINQSSAALNGGMMPPTYNPYASNAPAFSYINPNTGAEFAQGTTGFMNAGTGATPGSPDTSGQVIGSVLGTVGSIAGAALSAFCWVAREVYGVANPKWLDFRDWLLNRGPKWLLKLYARHGERFAQWLKYRPKVKTFLRVVMDSILALDKHKNHRKKDK